MLSFRPPLARGLSSAPVSAQGNSQAWTELSGSSAPRAWPRGLIPSCCGRPPPAAPHPVLGAAAWGPVRRRHLSPRALPACGSVAGAASGLVCARPVAVLLRPGSLSGRGQGLCWTPALCWVPSQGPRHVSFLSEGGRCGRVLRREAAGCSSAPSSSPTPHPRLRPARRARASLRSGGDPRA